jgi:hypothetical protein
MGLSMRERHAIVRELAPRFQRASKKQRSHILDEFVPLTGYTRCYAAFVLRTCGKKTVRSVGGHRVVFIPAHARSPGAQRHRPCTYGSPALLEALRRLWALSDGLCGKRLVVFIRHTLPLVLHQGALRIVDASIQQKLLTISAATVDRLLAPTKALLRLKGRSTTRPGTLLKHHIPIRTFADWNEQRPGFCEVDLVAHDGGSAWGDYIHTLNLTDVATGWTEPLAVRNKAQCHVFDGLKQIRARLPFPLFGLDSDNGSEFINGELCRYCEDEHLTFTRSRPYRKNDSCFVEQKNYSIVRRTVGYYRYDTPEQLALLQELYRCLRLYTNFFIPVMRLKEKLRHGSKVTRRYDNPQTPYHRLLAHQEISGAVKDEMTGQYEQLNIIQLARRLRELQDQLFRSAIEAGPPPPPRPGYPAKDHPWRVTNDPKLRILKATTSSQSNPTVSGRRRSSLPAEQADSTISSPLQPTHHE